MSLWTKTNASGGAPKFVTDPATGETGTAEYGTEVVFVTGLEGYPVASGWASKKTRGSRTRWESLVVFKPVVAPISFMLTAGQSGGFKGFQAASFGSVSRQPLSGALTFFAHNATDGSISFTGDLTAQLAGKRVYINGAAVAVGTTWAFSSGSTSYTWTGSVPQMFTNGSTYLVEIK